MTEPELRLEASEDETPLGRYESILLVEDDEAVRAVTQSILRSLGYEVHTEIGARLNGIEHRARVSALRLHPVERLGPERFHVAIIVGDLLDEEGLDHQAKMPDVPGPEKLPSEAEVRGFAASTTGLSGR